ncbi:tRNA-dihydrouridine(16/17) synthase [NAD(P)(+)]-like isoform X6 [Osmia bicornis bicornis]|uniref:tRNA-dihydrouridine(16/17) synthase [NAD(P)(+)]-like isoform X6 n=1 Tax=Osmia bicornis bicornis TaxID=1437191 RepID=UPI0010F7A078|nr:tRNA-dihydrouridine(16/17) synthase [NAD(P)(+)]-like isoform X6 [Osmia bicornis bicornis]
MRRSGSTKGVLSKWCSSQNAFVTPERRKFRRVHGLQLPLHPQQVMSSVSAKPSDQRSDQASEPANVWETVLGSPRYIVAPMVDASELAWRLLSRRHGAHLCYTPMLHSSVFCRDPKYRREALASTAEDRPLIVQFCGNDPNTLLEAALLAEPYCDAVDVNIGCPQAIAKRGRYGAFLQDDWDLLRRIVSTLSKGLRVPVTCKLRVFAEIEKTVEYARMLEKAGARLLTVHGRTREQKGPLTGVASWDHIKAVRLCLAENKEERENLARNSSMESFKSVVYTLRDRYLPYHEGRVRWQQETSDYNLELPPWLCQPYARHLPEECVRKLETGKLETQREETIKRKFKDDDGNEISRKRLKKLRRIARRPNRPTVVIKRGSELCHDCPNPVGLKCVHKLCRQCCRNKCFTENLDCIGHRNLTKTRRQMAIEFAAKRKTLHDQI